MTGGREKGGGPGPLRITVNPTLEPLYSERQAHTQVHIGKELEGRARTR